MLQTIYPPLWFWRGNAHGDHRGIWNAQFWRYSYLHSLNLSWEWLRLTQPTPLIPRGIYTVICLSTGQFRINQVRCHLTCLQKKLCRFIKYILQISSYTPLPHTCSGQDRRQGSRIACRPKGTVHINKFCISFVEMMSSDNCSCSQICNPTPPPWRCERLCYVLIRYQKIAIVPSGR